MAMVSVVQAYLRFRSIGVVQRSAATWRSCCSEQMNQMNSHSGSVLWRWRTINVVAAITITITMFTSGGVCITTL